MLNPSTADDEHDDPTLRRCLAFARDWGCGSLEVANLFARRSTDPRCLRHHWTSIGPGNDDAIRQAARSSDVVVAAWGARGGLGNRAGAVRDLLPGPVHCLGVTRNGQPRHPLYLPSATRLVPLDG